MTECCWEWIELPWIFWAPEPSLDDLDHQCLNYDLLVFASFGGNLVALHRPYPLPRSSMRTDLPITSLLVFVWIAHLKYNGTKFVAHIQFPKSLLSILVTRTPHTLFSLALSLISLQFLWFNDQTFFIPFLKQNWGCTNFKQHNGTLINAEDGHSHSACPAPSSASSRTGSSPHTGLSPGHKIQGVPDIQKVWLWMPDRCAVFTLFASQVSMIGHPSW